MPEVCRSRAGTRVQAKAASLEKQMGKVHEHETAARQAHEYWKTTYERARTVRAASLLPCPALHIQFDQLC